MPWRVLSQLLNNEQVIKQLSESAPIRAAAKLIVRGAASAEEKIADLKLEKKAERISNIFKEEYKKALEDVEKKK